MNYHSIEINKLSKSPLNARKTAPKGASEDLKASILAHGLMQNLVVTADDDGTYRVIEGARRLEALQSLQKDGHLPADYAVSCQIVADADAFEKSLAANTIRVAMHPADEYEAFAKLAESNLTPEQIGQRFGRNARYVEQRLRLGNLDPKLLKEYRAGNLTLDSLMAYAITDDRRRQLKVSKSLVNGQRNNPRAIRAALTEAMAEADSKLARFVGLEAYRDAGGTTQSDLFSEAVYLEDAELLHDLATGKLDQVKRQLESEGWAWVEISFDRDWNATYGMGSIRAKLLDIPAELEAERDQVQAELSDLEDEQVPFDTDEQRDAYARLSEIEERISALAAFDPEEQRFAGCYVSVNDDGSLRVEKGLVRRQDAKHLRKAEPKEHKPKGMPATLKRDLEAYRQQAAQAEIARNRLVALDLLIFTATSSACRMETVTGLKVNFEKQTPAVKEQTPAGDALAAAGKALPLSWLKAKTEAERFRLFSYLSDADKQTLLAWCVASSLKPLLSTGREDTAYELALSLTGGSVASYWRPTAANYLSRITRDQLLALIRELLGEHIAASSNRSKKSELVAFLDRVFAGPEKYGKTPEQTQRIEHWLPEGMAFTTPEQPKPKKKTAKKAA